MEVSILIFLLYSGVTIGLSVFTGWYLGQLTRIHRLEYMYKRILDKQHKIIRSYERHIRNEGDGWKLGLN